jgi:hypothetical protein
MFCSVSQDLGQTPTIHTTLVVSLSPRGRVIANNFNPDSCVNM